MSMLPRRNSPAELDAFEQVCRRLAGFADHVNFELVDGYMTGLATLPVWPPGEDWIEDLADDAFERAFADPPDRAQALKVLHMRLSVLRDQLDPEALSFNPGLLRLEPVLFDPTPVEGAPPPPMPIRLASEWAIGCVCGLEYVERSLGVAADALPADYAPLLGLIDELTRRDDEADIERREQQFDRALFAVQEIRLWALDMLPRIEPRRVEKAPGRNDPCPCGSGKKFKKCHGV